MGGEQVSFSLYTTAAMTNEMRTNNRPQIFEESEERSESEDSLGRERRLVPLLGT